jgi:hypothetical protein
MARLKLAALDAEDLAVVSAATQDALVAVKDVAHFAAERRLALVLNRFQWEVEPDADGAFRRTHAALVFDEVIAVRHRGVPVGEPDRVLDLLALGIEPAEGVGVAVELRFAAGRTIRVEAARLLCRLEDLGEPWPTPSKPDHPE